MASPLPAMIVVLDEEPSRVRALAGLLRQDGAIVGMAGNGARAVAQLQARPYDVLLCALPMLDLDGPTCSAILACQYPALHLRVICLPGESGSATSMAFRRPWNRLWLCKPGTIAPVRSAIQQGLHAAEALGGSTTPRDVPACPLMERHSPYDGHVAPPVLACTDVGAL